MHSLETKFYCNTILIKKRNLLTRFVVYKVTFKSNDQNNSQFPRIKISGNEPFLYLQIFCLYKDA